jgi:hypothetical protein
MRDRHRFLGLQKVTRHIALFSTDELVRHGAYQMPLWDYTKPRQVIVKNGVSSYSNRPKEGAEAEGVANVHAASSFVQMERIYH